MVPIARFSDYKKLVSWAGLTPSALRWAMIEGARVAAAQHDKKLGGGSEGDACTFE